MLERISFEHIDPKDVTAYDLHYHTEYSFDCQTPLLSVLKAAEQKGINLAITDHNTITGNLKARALKPKITILPAVEITFAEHRDLLFYFSSPKDLIVFYEKEIKPKLPQGTNMHQEHVLDFLEHFEPETYQAVLVLPHPFGKYRKNIYSLFSKRPEDWYLLDKVHGFEIFNSVLPPKLNRKAVGWAYAEHKSITAGSDGHLLEQLGNGITYSYTESDILEAIRKNKTYITGAATNYLTKGHYLESYLKGYFDLKVGSYRERLEQLEHDFKGLKKKLSEKRKLL
ncbi:MAG: PHP-associated domain-containing protein, partial [Candidatus Woesearchaeota archaeon]